MLKKFCNIVFIFLALCLFSHSAYANAGLPMIIVIEYWAVILFIPIIMIEAMVFQKYWPMVGYKKILKITFWSNCFSTFIGLPITWAVLLAIDWSLGGGAAHGLQTWGSRLYAVTVQAPWLVPYESNFYWMVPTATMVLLVPFFFVSVWTEAWVVKRFCKDQDPKHIKQITCKANMASYAFLYALAIMILWKGVH